MEQGCVDGNNVELRLAKLYNRSKGSVVVDIDEVTTDEALQKDVVPSVPPAVETVPPVSETRPPPGYVRCFICAHAHSNRDCRLCKWNRAQDNIDSAVCTGIDCDG